MTVVTNPGNDDVESNDRIGTNPANDGTVTNPCNESVETNPGN